MFEWEKIKFIYLFIRIPKTGTFKTTVRSNFVFIVRTYNRNWIKTKICSKYKLANVIRWKSVTQTHAIGKLRNTDVAWDKTIFSEVFFQVKNKHTRGFILTKHLDFINRKPTISKFILELSVVDSQMFHEQNTSTTIA